MMIIDAAPYNDIPRREDLGTRAIGAVIRLLESRLGVSIVRDRRSIPFGRDDLVAPLAIAEKLHAGNVVMSPGRLVPIPDEVPLKSWGATSAQTNLNVGGAHFESDEQALYATLAEGLERYLWMKETDHFKRAVVADTQSIARRGAYIPPERFAGFTDEQRRGNPTRALRADTPYLWVEGMSLVSNLPTYAPAQTVSGIENDPRMHGEPFIRQRTTIGLATWPDRPGALLAGALECIERDAYMVMWLNQLTPPRLALPGICAHSPSLGRLIDACTRYRFKVHVTRMPTDAPTHAICVVLEDLSGHGLRFSLGLRAHSSLPIAVEKALMEAIRGRSYYRRLPLGEQTWDQEKPVISIGHVERLAYWAVPEHARELEFLIRGEEEGAREAVWENDTPSQHLERIVDWCRNAGYECVSVSLGISKKNPTSWHVEVVIMPELQPAYLMEPFRVFGGKRWKEVPGKLGYTPLSEPYAGSPHPFA